jgi:hypothetical protein
MRMAFSQSATMKTGLTIDGKVTVQDCDNSRASHSTSAEVEIFHV